jgi:hypothetical protein
MAIRPSKETWAAVRLAYISGQTAKELERLYGVPADAIHRRSSRYQWAASAGATEAITCRVADRLDATCERLAAICGRLENVLTTGAT